MRRTKAQLPLTAYHEAGHAIVAWRYHIAIHHVTIGPSEDSLGHVLYKRYANRFLRDIDIKITPTKRDHIENRIRVCLGGPYA